MGRKIKKFWSFLKTEEDFKKLGLPFWKQPDFLLFILVLINIAGMLGTYFWASRKVDPREAVLWVALESSFILIIGNTIIELFKKSLSALKLKKDFISIISHQLRNPLTAIKWNLEGLEKESARLSDKQKLCLQKITVANETLIELSDNFIFLEKLEDSRSIEKQPVDGTNLLKEKIEDFSVFASAKAIEIKTFFGSRRLLVLANEDLLKIIFDNFLSNAIRYSFEKSTISVRIKKRGREVFFMFENVGVAIEKEDQGRLFEKFYRSESAKEFSPQGSGLGLYISKVLTEKMGGNLGFFIRGKKTIFWVSFPQIEK